MKSWSNEDELLEKQKQSKPPEEIKYLYAYRAGNFIRLWHEPVYGNGFLGRIKLESNE